VIDERKERKKKKLLNGKFKSQARRLLRGKFERREKWKGRMDALLFVESS
jgi:hypothetical protein